MTQEDKELLLKDLCARLPYGVKVQVYDNRYAPTTLTAINVKKQKCIFNFSVPVDNCLPYLRPISSITEEERGELRKFCRKEEGILYDIGISGAINAPAIIDYLNAHHFDYRGLIENGLAIEASEGIYEY